MKRSSKWREWKRQQRYLSEMEAAFLLTHKLDGTNTYLLMDLSGSEFHLGSQVSQSAPAETHRASEDWIETLPVHSHCHPKQKRNPGYACNRDSQLEAHRIWIKAMKQFSLATETQAGSQAKPHGAALCACTGSTVSCICLNFMWAANPL